MKFFKLALIVIGLGLASCAEVTSGSLVAVTATSSERSAIDQAARSLSRSISQQRFEQVLDTTPPKLRAALAQRAGVNETELREITAQSMRVAFSLVSIESFGMATERAQFFQTAGGARYALVPTSTRMRSPVTGRIQIDSMTLAIPEGNRWYLIRMEEGRNREIFNQTYPQYRAISVPQPRTTQL